MWLKREEADVVGLLYVGCTPSLDIELSSNITTRGRCYMSISAPQSSHWYSFAGKRTGLFVWTLLLLISLTVGPVYTLPAPQAVTDLSFQADIYGDSTPETIRYVADLAFHNYGSFGTNALVVTSGLTGGDGISYAVSYNKTNVFSFSIAPVGTNTTTTLTISRDAYPAGSVSVELDGSLHFVWDVQHAPYHFKLHKRVSVVVDDSVKAGRYFLETFTIENIGHAFDLWQFSETLHIDDIARVRDFDGNGELETLLAVNNYSTSGFPVFGKVSLRRQGISTNFESNGIFATVNYLPLYRTIPTGTEQEIARAGYVTGLTKSSMAEQDVAADARYLLAARPCEIPFFSQIDLAWARESLPCPAPYDTIGKGGCTLTATASVLNAFGSATDPLLLNACLGSRACPLDWSGIPTCSGGTVTFAWNKDHRVNWNADNPAQSWARLESELNDHHRPVLLGMRLKKIGRPHWVLVVSGTGDSADGYRVHDPQYRCGANLPLANYSQLYDFTTLVVYHGVVGCSSLTTLTPLCTRQQQDAQPVLSGTSMATDSLASGSAGEISGSVVMFSATTLTMTVEVTATSSAGIITEVQVWSDTMANTQWQPFTPLLWLPLSEQVYVRFRDDQGNISDVYSTTPYPTDPETIAAKLFLPIIRR